MNQFKNYEPQKGRVRGRGVRDNKTNRFERVARYGVDDGWETMPEDRVVRTQVRTERPRKIITRNTSPDISFDRSLNPYRGCEHGCVYCFARPSHAFLNLSPGLDFETQLIARPDAPKLLAKELSHKSYDPAPLAFGTNTDPYQPIENRYRIMRQCLEVLESFGHPTTITTKGSLIERDIDILARLAGRNLVSVGITLTTLDPKVARAMETRVPAPARTLQMMQRLSDAGIPVRVLVSPVVPGLTDHEMENILEAAQGAGAKGASWVLLRLPREVAPIFVDWVYETFPNRAAKIMARVRESHGGRDYDPDWGKRLRGQGAHAMLLGQRFKLACTRLGLAAKMPALSRDQFAVPPQPGDQMSLF